MIVGTPTASTYNPYYLKLTDSSPNPQSIILTQSYSIAGPLGIHCPGNGPSLIGETYFVQCGASGGIGLANTWISAGALPAGLTLLRGFIQGTPTTPGPYSYTISAADNLTPTPATASQTLTGVITPLPAALDVTNVSGSMAHLAIGDGWSTTTVLMNPGANYAQAHVGYFGDGGSPLGFPLSAGGTVTTTSAADQVMAAHSMFVVSSATPPGDPLQEGSANLTTDGRVNGFIRFRYAPRDEDATVPLEIRKAAAYVLSFDNTNGIATGVALANLSANAANVPVVMRDDTGAQIGSASLPLTGKGHTAFVLTDKFSTLVNRRGTVEFDTPPAGQISVLGLRFPPGQQFTTIPVIANTDAGGGSLAHLAVGNGWTSTVELVNFGATAAQAHLKFFGDDGSPLPLPLAFATTTATTSTVDQPMTPHSRLVVQSTAIDSDPLQTGSAQLTTDGSVSGFIRFRYGPRNQEAIVPIESRNSSTYIVAFDNTNGLAAGVAVANLSASAVTIPVLIRDSAGAQLGAGVVTLAASGHSAFVLSDQFVAAKNQSGTVEFDAPAGSKISVLGLRFPASGAFSTIPVVIP